jgi:hypothetical protein
MNGNKWSKTSYATEHFPIRHAGQFSDINLYLPFKPKRVETESIFFLYSSELFMHNSYSCLIFSSRFKQ